MIVGLFRLMLVCLNIWCRLFGFLSVLFVWSSELNGIFLDFGIWLVCRLGWGLGILLWNCFVLCVLMILWFFSLVVCVILVMLCIIWFWCWIVMWWLWIIGGLFVVWWFLVFYLGRLLFKIVILNWFISWNSY